MAASLITPTPPSGTAEYPTGGEATNFVVPLTGCLPGDVLVINITTTTEGLSGAALTVPGGVVTLSALSSATGAGISGGLYWYTVPETPPANVTFVWAAARRGSAAWVQLRPSAGGDLVNNAFAPGAWSGAITAAPTAPSITTTEANCFIVAGTMYGSGSATTGAPSGFILRTNATQREGSIATKGVQSAAGATGTAVFDTSSSGSYLARAWQLAVFESGAAAVPVWQELIQGIPTSTGQIATVRAQDTDDVELRVSTTRSGDTLTGTVLTGAAVTPNAAGWCRATITGLTPDTWYYLQARLTNETGVTESSVLGPFTTAPVPGTPKSFSILFGGDLQDSQGDVIAFTNMATQTDAVLTFSNGDTHNGDNISSSQASHRADWENILSVNSGFRSMLRNRPFAQSYGDHDPGGGNNGIPGVWTAPNIAAYQEVMPYPDTSPALPATSNWSVVHGRVRIIAPDYVHERTSTYKLGAAQMAWLEAELQQPEPLKVLLVGAVWYDMEAPVGWPDGDGWADYPAHRAAIQALIENAVGKVVGVHGDQHADAAMSGAGNQFGGFPVVGGSPWSGWSSHKGDVTPDHGRWPLVEGAAIVHQYGKLSFDDNGDYIVVTYQGFDDANVARVTMTFGTDGFVEPAIIPTTSTASLTAPVDRWVKGVMRPVWFDETAGKWRAILPAGASGHRFYDLDVDTGGTQGAVVDNRAGVRVTAFHSGGLTYVLRARTAPALFAVYDSSLTKIGADTSLSLTGITDLDAQPVTLLRSPNGHLWIGWTGSGAARVMRSTDGGATFTAQSIVTQADIQGPVGLVMSGNTVVMIVTGNDGLGRWVRTINQDAASHAAASWSTEALPALPSPLTSDDHMSTLSLPDGRVMVSTKTTGSTTDSQTLLYSLIRETSGIWSQQRIQVGPDDDPGWTRPTLTCDGGEVVVFYGNYAGARELVKRTTPSDSLGVWSERTTLLAAGDFSDSPVAPGPGCITAAEGRPWPVLAHDRATKQIWLLWQGISQGGGSDLPIYIGTEPLTGVYIGSEQLTAIYVGAEKVF